MLSKAQSELSSEGERNCKGKMEISLLSDLWKIGQKITTPYIVTDLEVG